MSCAVKESGDYNAVNDAATQPLGNVASTDAATERLGGGASSGHYDPLTFSTTGDPLFGGTSFGPRAAAHAFARPVAPLPNRGAPPLPNAEMLAALAARRNILRHEVASLQARVASAEASAKARAQ